MSRNNCVISVIIPCFNAENCIDRCLSSLQHQTCKKFECIIINDGSSDNSKNIIENFIKYNNNFRTINQENSGVSNARNAGIKAAKASYISFIDADDYVNNNYIEELVHEITMYPHIDIFQFNTRNSFYSASVWSKCIKKEFIITNQIRFFEDNVIGEDMVFCEICRLNTTKIHFVNKKIYNYQTNQYSASKNLKKRFEIYKSLDSLIDYINKHNFKKDYRLNNVIYRHGIIYPLVFLKENHIINKKKYEMVIKSNIKKYNNFLKKYQRVFILDKTISSIIYIKILISSKIKYVIKRLIIKNQE